MTIRLRLTLWYTALLGATLILFSVVVYSALSTNLYIQVQTDARSQADEVQRFLVQELDPPGTLMSRVQLPDRDLTILVPIIRLPPNLVTFFGGGVQIFDIKNGKVYKRSGPGSESVSVLPATLAAVRDGEHYSYVTTHNKGTRLLVYSVPLLIDGKIMGGVQIIQSIGPVELALFQIRRYLVIGTTLSLVLAAIVGAFLARRALIPINTITQTASSITRTKDLARRLTITDDASEVGQLAATFNEMLDRVQRLFKAQERLIADVSHELRTPLTTVQGNVDLLQRMMNTPALQTVADQPAGNQVGVSTALLQETLQEVEGETIRMGGMISDLLLLAQADSGEVKLQMNVVEMDTLLLEVYRSTQRIAERSKGSDALEVRLGSEDQALVHGDRERLRQLLLNLAENAVKYTPRGGTITLGLKNDDGWVQVYVEDTGIGISAENQVQIFERFYRADRARSREMGGSGLGLSIAQWIAKAHEGHIMVKSLPQQGSTFTVWLPEFTDTSAHLPH